MRSLSIATLALVVAACFSERTDFPSGVIRCNSETRACPSGMSCASDGRCWKQGSGPPDAGPDAPTRCVEDELRCGGAGGKEQQRCQAGVFVPVTVCGNACLSGFCVECVPTTRRCDGQKPQLCGETGSWSDLASCPAATPQCEDGVCVPPCAPAGVRRCGRDGISVQECDPAGQFRTVATCMNVCIAGPPVECGGECRPGTRQCAADQTPESCSTTGDWVPETPCPGVCAAGACGGECRPATTRCASGTTVQTCGADARWGTTSSCPFVCDAATGACGGVCSPGARRCNGSRAELCDAGGHWTFDAQCPVGQCTDGRCGPCTDGRRQCNAGMPQLCSGGFWSDTQPAPCPFLCDATLGCTGECVPGSSTCAGDVKRSCGSDARYTDETCAFVCLAGQCAGSCEPGAHRCNGPASQTCNSSGEWGGGQSCAFGCDQPSGECAACVPEPLATTCAGGGCGEKKNNCGDTVTCPACTGTGQSCGGGGLAGFCGCTPDPAATTCAGRCAPTQNNCGQTVDCPTDACVAPQSCGGGGTPGACGCAPVARDTACAGKNCGTVPDGCGGQISCWPEGQTSCPGTGETCGGGSPPQPNVCGCTPNAQCGTRECGMVSDGCGGMVACGPMGGGCPVGEVCDPNGQCGGPCVPRTMCDEGFVCGTQEAGCGLPPISCGECLAPLVCDDTTHKCCKKACTNDRVCGTEPDGCGGTLVCGACPDDQVCDPTGRCRCRTRDELCGAAVCETFFPPTVNCPAVSCGTCPPERYCSANHTACLCRSKEEACLGKECPPDFMWGTCGPYACGSCTPPESCGGGGIDFTCGCTPTMDADFCKLGGRECGPWQDNCGNAIDCGKCGDPTICLDGKCVIPPDAGVGTGTPGCDAGSDGGSCSL